jgi:hypothetical protein
MIGVRDMVVVHTGDATMVCPRGRAEQVKQLVGEVGAAHGDRYL